MVSLCRGRIRRRQCTVKQLCSPSITTGGDCNRDYVHTITPDTPDAYATLKNVLNTRFSPTQIDNCLKLLDMPLMGDRHPLAYHSDIMTLLPADGNVLVNAIFLHGLPEVMRAALADKVELKPIELVQATARLPHSTAVQAPVSVNAAPTAAPSPPVLAANAAPFVPRQPIRPTSRGRRSPTSHRPFQGGRRTPCLGRPEQQLPQSPLSSGLCLYHYNFGFP